MSDLRLSRSLSAGLGLVIAILTFSAVSSTSASAACVRGVSRGDVLWIRSGPGGRFGRIGSFGRRECGIKIFWNSCSGSWCRVRKGGRQGWTHSRYLGGGGHGHGMTGLCAKSCQSLWISRNKIFKNNGFCFKTQRARNYFGNGGCWTSNPRLSKWERRRVNAIRNCEARKGC